MALKIVLRELFVNTLKRTNHSFRKANTLFWSLCTKQRLFYDTLPLFSWQWWIGRITVTFVKGISRNMVHKCMLTVCGWCEWCAAGYDSYFFFRYIISLRCPITTHMIIYDLKTRWKFAAISANSCVTMTVQLIRFDASNKELCTF